MHRAAVNFPENATPAIVALGANLGDRAGTLTAALLALEKRGIAVVACSSFIETKPVGYLDQPDFLNAVALVTVPAGMSAEFLLGELLAVEKEFGRVRTFPSAPRTLDLDLILFGNETRATPLLTLPHPRWRERDFVKIPLAEIFRKLGDAVPECFREAQNFLRER